MKTYLLTIFIMLAVCAVSCMAQETQSAAVDVQAKTDQVTANLMVMMGTSWGAIKEFGISLTKGIFAWFCMMLVIGIGLGTLSWMIVRRAGLLHLDVKAYRYFSWLWVFVFMVPITIGAVSSSLGIAFERSFKHLIIEQEFCRKLVANVYCAAALNTVDYALTGSETVEDLTAILNDSEGLQEVVNQDIGSMVKDLANDMAAEGELPQIAADMLSTLSDSWLGSKASEVISKDDPALLIMTMYAAMAGGEQFAIYKEQNPQADALISGIGVYMDRLENQAIMLVSTTTRSATTINFIVAFTIPIVCVLLFQLLRRVIRNNAPEDGAPKDTVDELAS